MGWHQEQDFPLPEKRSLDPPMWEVLREAEQGNGVVMVSYGYSGAGKTTTLIGDADAPIGGANGLDGVLSIYLHENNDRIQDVRVRILELYGRISAADGSLMTEAGSGLWGYALQAQDVEYLGSAKDFISGDGQVNFDLLQERVSDTKFTLNLRDVTTKDLSGRMDWGSKVKNLLQEVEALRMNANEFDAGGEPLAHIRATPNNPKSSRGSLMVALEIDFVSGVTGNVAVVDLAGAEDPVVLASGFMSFTPSDDGTGCIGSHAWVPSGPEASNTKLMNKYLHHMSNEEYLNGELGGCIRLRDLLVDCDRKKPKPECVDIELSNGQRKFVRPDMLADEAWVYKSRRQAKDQAEFVWKWRKKTFTFSQEEVLAALRLGKVRMVNGLKASTRGGKADSWPERLWSKGAEIDTYVLMQKKPMEKDKFGYMPGPEPESTEAYIMQGIPKDVCKLGGVAHSERGTIFRDDKTDSPTGQWKEARESFWNALYEYLNAYDDREDMINNKWELHMKFFTQAVGALTQESFFINEALNQMQGYMGAWAHKSSRVSSGAPLGLWPATDMAMQIRTPQILDSTPGSDFTENGYDLYKYIQGSQEDESYALRASRGSDEVMMLTMLESLRRPAESRGKVTKVLFGAFVRTDQPGSDPDCAGARVSLEFAQGLSEAVGWRRSNGLTHLH